MTCRHVDDNIEQPWVVRIILASARCLSTTLCQRFMSTEDRSIHSDSKLSIIFNFQSISCTRPTICHQYANFRVSFLSWLPLIKHYLAIHLETTQCASYRVMTVTNTFSAFFAFSFCESKVPWIQVQVNTLSRTGLHHGHPSFLSFHLHRRKKNSRINVMGCFIEGNVKIDTQHVRSLRQHLIGLVYINWRGDFEFSLRNNGVPSPREGNTWSDVKKMHNELMFYSGPVPSPLCSCFERTGSECGYGLASPHGPSWDPNNARNISEGENSQICADL